MYEKKIKITLFKVFLLFPMAFDTTINSLVDNNK